MLAAGPLAGLRASACCTAGCRPTRRSARCAPSPSARSTCWWRRRSSRSGVDVANATAMVVLDADRFGVSQLHQLRGRVGRGGHPGLCLLVTDAEADSPARERLDAVAATTDGFELSRLDLEQRREGDVLGASQSGRRSGLRLLSVHRRRGRHRRRPARPPSGRRRRPDADRSSRPAGARSTGSASPSRPTSWRRHDAHDDPDHRRRRRRPPDHGRRPGTRTRPTSDRVREALFSSLESSLGSLSGLRFLDLYAGSGAIGLEARSRGAGVGHLRRAGPRAPPR